MNKLKLFLENFIIYGFGGIISKIIPIIMIPIVTRLMPDSSYYGLSDLSNTVIQFGSAFAVMGMYDAMYRMFFEKDEEQFKKQVCSTAFTFTIATSFIVFFIMLIFRNLIAQYFFSNKQYAYVVYLSAMATLVGATNSIIAAPVRMQNKRRVFLITNTISPVLSYGMAIPMLLKGYYTIALPLAAVISGAAMEVIFFIMNRKWFDIKLFNFQLLKQLLVIAVPLLPNFLIYWIFNSCDKVMITNMLGIEEAGIYSVGSKLGHCSQLIYTAFAGGWQYFAFSTMRDADQVKTNSKVFEYLGIISFVVSMFVCAFSYPLFQFLFPKEYLSGYIIAPYLFLSPLLQMLFQVAGNQFVVIKKTWPNMLILSAGALINIAINIFLIPILGIEGAALATLVGYAVSVIICVIVLIYFKLMEISRKFLTVCLIMIIFLLIWRILFSDLFLISGLAALSATAIVVILYHENLKSFLQIKNTLKRKKC